MGKPRNVSTGHRFTATCSLAPSSVGVETRLLLQRLFIFISAIQVLTQVNATFECPTDHYPYGGCSSCFTIINQGLNFYGALERCDQLGGNLLTTENEQQLKLLSRYLSGLRESGQLWIGYRLSSSGSRIGLKDDEAPSVVLDDENFDGSTSGNNNSCIGIWGDKYVVESCAETLPFICTITYTAPSAIRHPNDDIVYAAPTQSDVELRANVSGTRIKSVEWKFNGMRITQNENGITISSSDENETGRTATLRISSYSSAVHLGMYELLVTSQAGTAIVATWQLRNAELQFTIEPDNLTLPEGQLAAFECFAGNAKPQARVTWYKDSTPINNGTNPRIYVSSLTGTLMIRELKTSDGGLYSCRVENVAGTLTSRQASLTVQPLSSSPEVATQFIVEPRDQTLLIGQPYSIECSAVQTVSHVAETTFHEGEGLSNPSVMAFRYPNDTGYPVYIVGGASLDGPLCYFCAVMTSPYHRNGFSFSRKSLITVHASAEVESISTVLNGMRSKDTSSQTVPTGDAAVLECEISGIPNPDPVEWTRDGVSVTDGITENFNTSSLTVLENSDNAIYQCHVENIYGRDTKTVFLCAMEEEDGIPEPVIFTAVPDTNTSIYVWWEQATPTSTHPLLLRYEVLLFDTISNVNLTFGPFLSTQLNYTITDLEPNMEYVVSVTASSLQGSSDVDTTLPVTTYPNAPSKFEVLENVTVERNDNNTILIIQWDPYRTSEGKEVSIATYEIEYRVANNDDGGVGGESVVVDVANGNSSIGIIPGLSNAASYEVRIRVTVQIRRDPPTYASSAWSDFIRVHGITTLPPIPTSSPRTDGVSEAPKGLSTTGLLLLIIFVCVGVVLLVVMVISAIVVVVCCKRKRGGKYTVRHAPELKQRRKKNSKGNGPQTPMRDEVFTLQGSLPTSPSPPPIADGSTDREILNNSTDNGICGSLPNQSAMSSPRSVSPLPLPPPLPDLDNPYSTVRANNYIFAPFSVSPRTTSANQVDPFSANQVDPFSSNQIDPFSTNQVNSFSSNQIDPFSSNQMSVFCDQVPPLPSINVGYTDEVHDISSDNFQKVDMSQYIFDPDPPEVFDRLEGFDPVPTFDILTTGGREDVGSYDTLPRDSIESREYSPATTTSLINQTPEPLADHRVTFAPAVITISPEPYVQEDQVKPAALVGLNSSNSNNNMTTTMTSSHERPSGSGGGGRGSIDISHLPPVAEIIEGEELSEQLEPSSTITL